MDEKKKKNYTPNEAIVKIEIYCNYQERCQQEVREKLFSFNLNSEEVEEILYHVVQRGWINEERYAKAFAGGKFRQNKWGRTKIIRALKQKKISDYCIEKAMREIDPDDYTKKLKALAEKHFQGQKTGKSNERKMKTIKFLMGKGYEYEECQAIMKTDFNN